jgi:hypothetical protein
MPWPPDIAGDLPALRDDEPSSLRHDIADELADHLQSSFTREMHFTPEESSAKQIVLDRFGDPRRIARALWFDAMKEKLVSQRVNLVFSSLMTVACLGALGLMVMMLRESRMATQALLEQSQAANAALLDKLAALASPASVPAVTEPAKSMEWNPVKLRLVVEKPGGSPAIGYKVHLQGNLLDSAKEIAIDRTTASDGLADMGLLRPGQHVMRVTTPWGETRKEATLTVLPGQGAIEEIVCPGADRELVPISVSFDWPEELRDKGLWVICAVHLSPRDIGGNPWRLSNASIYVIFDSANRVASPPLNKPIWADYPFDFDSRPVENKLGLLFDDRKLMPWNHTRGGQFGGVAVAAGAPGPEVTHALRPFHFRFPNSPARAELRLPAGHYTMNSILLAESSTVGPENGLQRLDVLGGLLAYYNYNQNPLTPFRETEFVVPFSDWFDKEIEHKYGYGDSTSNAIREKAQPKFEVVAGDPNRIKIPLHPRLVENVIDFLEFTK